MKNRVCVSRDEISSVESLPKRQSFTDILEAAANNGTIDDMKCFVEYKGADVNANDDRSTVQQPTDQQTNRMIVARQLDCLNRLRAELCEQIEQRFGECPFARILSGIHNTKDYDSDGHLKFLQRMLLREQLDAARLETAQEEDIGSAHVLLLIRLIALDKVIVVYERFLQLADGEVSEANFRKFHREQVGICINVMWDALTSFGGNLAEFSNQGIDSDAVHKYLRKFFGTHREKVAAYLAFLDTLKSFSLVLDDRGRPRKTTMKSTRPPLERTNAVAAVERRSKKLSNFRPLSYEEIIPLVESVCQTLFDGRKIFHLVAVPDGYDVRGNPRDRSDIMPMALHSLERFVQLTEDHFEEMESIWAGSNVHRILGAEYYHKGLFFINNLYTGERKGGHFKDTGGWRRDC